MDVNNPTVKILIAYHKPAPLIKSDIFVPIHVGRSVAKEVSKDGVISDEDLKWLKDNMIGDDTGDNISYLNRSFCELTAIYWAWKNYDKLENPDYIGLCHYRRFFQFYGYKYNITQISSHDLIEYVKQFRAIVPEPLFIRDPSLHTFSTYQNLCHLNTDYHSDLYQNYILFEKIRNLYTANMFIFKKEDFFHYCEMIFSILFKIHKQKNLLQTNDYKAYVDKMMSLKTLSLQKKQVINDQGEFILMPRLYGYIAEYLTTFYIMNFVIKGDEKLAYASIVTIDEQKAETKSVYCFFGIPLLTQKKNSREKIYKLFGFIPMLKIKRK